MNFVRVRAHPSKDIVFKFSEEDATKYIAANPHAAVIPTPVGGESQPYGEPDPVDAQGVNTAGAEKAPAKK